MFGQFVSLAKTVYVNPLSSIICYSLVYSSDAIAISKKKSPFLIRAHHLSLRQSIFCQSNSSARVETSRSAVSTLIKSRIQFYKRKRKMENLAFFCCSTPRESSPEHDSGIHLTPESGYYEEKTSYTHNFSDLYERYLQNTNLDGSFESGSQSQKSEDLFSREDMQSQTLSETSMQTIEEEVYYKNLAEEFMGPPVETSLSQESQTNFTQEINEAVDDGQLYPNSQDYYREMAEEFEREEEMIHPDSQRPESQQWSSQLSESYAIFEKTDSDQ